MVIEYLAVLFNFPANQKSRRNVCMDLNEYERGLKIAHNLFI